MENMMMLDAEKSIPVFQEICNLSASIHGDKTGFGKKLDFYGFAVCFALCYFSLEDFFEIPSSNLNSLIYLFKTYLHQVNATDSEAQKALVSVNVCYRKIKETSIASESIPAANMLSKPIYATSRTAVQLLGLSRDVQNVTIVSSHLSIFMERCANILSKTPAPPPPKPPSSPPSIATTPPIQPPSPPPQEELHSSNIRYCKYCGNKLNSNGLCAGCGRKSFSISDLKGIVISLALVGIIALSIHYSEIWNFGDDQSVASAYSPVSSSAVAMQYVASIKGEKFHLPDCRWVKNIKYENLIYLESIDDAEEQGYTACATCNP